MNSRWPPVADEISAHLMHITVQGNPHTVLLKMPQELEVRHCFRAGDGMAPHGDAQQLLFGS